MIKHNRSSHSAILRSDFSSPPHRLCRQLSFSSKPCVRMGQSLLRAAHIFPLVFYRSQPWREKSRTQLSAPFCAYATVINETPGRARNQGLVLKEAREEHRTIRPQLIQEYLTRKGKYSYMLRYHRRTKLMNFVFTE